MSECEVKEKSETYVIAIANVPHPIPLHRTAARVNLTLKHWFHYCTVKVVYSKPILYCFEQVYA